MAGYEICLVDQVCGLDRMFAEPQVRHGQSAGFLGVIVKITLGVQVGLITDDLDGCFVGTDGSVRSQTPEFTFDSAFRFSCNAFDEGQGVVGHIVLNTDGEMILRPLMIQVIINGHDHARGGVLGAKAVAAAVNLRRVSLGIKHGAHILVQRLSESAGLLRPVKHSDALYGLRQHIQEILPHKRAVQAHLDEADPVALGDEGVHGFLDGFTDRAHGNDDVLGVRGAHIVEGLVAAAGEFFQLLHIMHNHFRDLIIEFVGRLSYLEENVRVLGSTADYRVLRIQGTVAELLYSIHVDEFAEVIVVQHLDLLDLVRSTETVEEMQERDAALDGGQMGDGCQIHDLLDGVGCQHGKTGLTSGHDIRVITENIQCMGGKAAGADMHYAGQQLSCNLVHIGNHEQQTLGCSVSGGKGTC